MSVYECHLVGRELREFEERTKARVTHIVFVDGKTQWSHRRSDLPATGGASIGIAGRT